MAITRRRQEFLQSIKLIYEQTKSPVHYTTIAQKLGISVWSAYDMLKELEKEGYLFSEYLLSKEKSVGRSQIVFSPTSKAFKVIAESGKLPVDIEEWYKTKEAILQKVEELKKLNSIQLIEEVTKGFPKVEASLTYCAYIIAFFLLYIKTVGGKGKKFAEKLVKTVSQPQAGLQMLPGIVFGIFAKKVSNINLIKQLSKLIGNYQYHLAKISLAEHELLMDFMEEIAKSG